MIPAFAGARIVEASTGRVLEAGELRDEIHRASADLQRVPPGVVFIRAARGLPAIVGYLGALDARRPVALLDPATADDLLAGYVGRYLPSAIHPWEGDVPDWAVPLGYRAASIPGLGTALVSGSTGPETHPDLAVLLPTSGSTGDPRFVRLSRAAIEANTNAIVETLGITEADVVVTALPVFYSYGMSVLNTHLAAGATVVLSDDGLASRTFWSVVDEFGVTTLSLVPAHFHILERLRFDPRSHRALRTLTQAGGRLRTESVLDFHDRLRPIGGRLFVMYGQTEGGPRLTTLPPSMLPAKAGSVGLPLPGGSIAIATDSGTTTEPRVAGEVVYRGPNVMMGYALDRADLALGDEMGGELHTGDEGVLDGDGCLTIVGRRNRIAKVSGVRVNLDDIERLLTGPERVVAVSGEDSITIWCEADPEALRKRVVALALDLRLHPSGFEVRQIREVPIMPNGKVDYRRLGALS